MQYKLHHEYEQQCCLCNAMTTALTMLLHACIQADAAACLMAYSICVMTVSSQDAYITQALRTNLRVTLQMGPQPTQMTLQQPGLGSGQQVLFGQLAKPSSPRESEGTYWGYTTRLATSLSQVFRDCPFEVSCQCILTRMVVSHLYRIALYCLMLRYGALQGHPWCLLAATLPQMCLVCTRIVCNIIRVDCLSCNWHAQPSRTMTRTWFTSWL